MAHVASQRRTSLGALLAAGLLVAGCVSVSPINPGETPAYGAPSLPAGAPGVATPPVAANPGGGPGNPGTGPVNPGGGAGNQGVVGVPSWIGPGTRLTWYAAAASIANSRFAWVEDPNGQWVDPATGKHYRRTDEAGPNGEPPQDQPTASGDGLSQIDVLAVEGNNVVLASNLYTFDRSHSADGSVSDLLLTPAGGQEVDGSLVDGAWASPALLAQYAGGSAAGLTVLHGPYQLNGTTFDALSFVNGLGGGDSSSYTYDLATGVLLSANTSTAGVTSPFAASGQNPPVGNSQLTMARFVDARQLTLPGVGDANPAWVNGTVQLTYSGSYNWVNPVDPSSGNLTYPVQITATITAGGANWASVSGRTQVPALAIDTQLQTVTGATGNYWYSPSALAGMSADQVLDQDPATGEQIKVGYVGPDQSGNSVVVVDDEVPGTSTQSTYRQSDGLLVAFQQASPQTTGITVSVQLVGGP